LIFGGLGYESLLPVEDTWVVAACDGTVPGRKVRVLLTTVAVVTVPPGTMPVFLGEVADRTSASDDFPTTYSWAGWALGSDGLSSPRSIAKAEFKRLGFNLFECF
jgi:hypothetical protein